MELPVLFVKTIFFIAICWGKGSCSDAATEFSTGDFVQITTNEDLIIELQSHGIGYLESMEETLGKIGRIQGIGTDGDLHVTICDDTWIFSAKAVKKLAPAAGDSNPQLSSACARSRATLSVTQRSFRDYYVELECQVNDYLSFVGLTLRWVKEGKLISRNPRIITPFKLLIKDVRPEDAGWYTCELLQDGNLIDTGAVEVGDFYTSFSVGDMVQITSDKDWLRKLHSRRIGYQPLLERTLGKIGRVNSITREGYLYVYICGVYWHYSTKGVTKITSAGTHAPPPVSSDCVNSDATIVVTKRSSGKMAELECLVRNRPVNSTLKWIKGSDLFSRNVDRSVAISTLKIREEKPEDEGWYTCEVRDKEGNLVATRAYELIVFKAGDVVQITSDEYLIEVLYRQGFYNSTMKSSLGKFGTVKEVASGGQLRVSICGTQWDYHPMTVTRFTSASYNTPLVSSSCVHSNAKVTVEQKKVDNTVRLECVVAHRPVDSTLRWFKGIDALSDDSYNITTNHRFNFSASLSSAPYTLNITNALLEDVGWYTCELLIRGRVAATGAAWLNI